MGKHKTILVFAQLLDGKLYQVVIRPSSTMTNSGTALIIACLRLLHLSLLHKHNTFNAHLCALQLYIDYMWGFFCSDGTGSNAFVDFHHGSPWLDYFALDFVFSLAFAMSPQPPMTRASWFFPWWWCVATLSKWKMTEPRRDHKMMTALS